MKPLLKCIAPVLVFAALLCFATPAHAQRNCGVQTLRGAYGVKIDGWYGTFPTGFNPGSVVGTITFDGAGGFKMVGSIAAPAFPVVLQNVDVTGSYVVNQNCTGSIVGTQPVEAKGHFSYDIVIVSQADEIFTLNSVAPYIQSGIMRRQ